MKTGIIAPVLFATRGIFAAGASGIPGKLILRPKPANCLIVFERTKRIAGGIRRSPHRNKARSFPNLLHGVSAAVAPLAHLPKPFGRWWSLNMDWQVARTMKNTPDENAILFCKHVVKNRITEHIYPARGIAVLGADAVQVGIFGGPVDNLVQTGDDKIRDLWRGFAGEVIPNLVEIAGRRLGDKDATSSHAAGRLAGCTKAFPCPPQKFVKWFQRCIPPLGFRLSCFVQKRFNFVVPLCQNSIQFGIRQPFV
jgi:hypothetical protein